MVLFVSRKVQGGGEQGRTSRDYAGGVSGRERGMAAVVVSDTVRAEQRQKSSAVREVQRRHPNYWKCIGDASLLMFRSCPRFKLCPTNRTTKNVTFRLISVVCVLHGMYAHKTM